MASSVKWVCGCTFSNKLEDFGLPQVGGSALTPETVSKAVLSYDLGPKLNEAFSSLQSEPGSAPNLTPVLWGSPKASVLC